MPGAVGCESTVTVGLCDTGAALPHPSTIVAEMTSAAVEPLAAQENRRCECARVDDFSTMTPNQFDVLRYARST